MSKEVPKTEPIVISYTVTRAQDGVSFSLIEVKTQGKKVLSSVTHDPSDVLYIIMNKVTRLIESQAKG